LTYCPHFNRPIWKKSGTRDVRRHLLGDYEFHENRRIESFILVRATNECLFCIFHIYCSICMGFGIRDLHATLLRTCEFSEKWHRKGPTFLMGVNEITFTGVS
jgi:hypothetical protein